MSKNANELIVASGGAISVAPIDTDLPEDIDTTLDEDFVELGFASNEGVTFSVAPEITEHEAWQSRQPIRRDLTAQELQASFELLQWNAENITLAFGGGAVTEPEPGKYRYDFPEDGDALQERAMVIDWVDGDKKYRIVFPRGNVTESVETNLTRSETAKLPITFKALEPAEGGPAAYLLTDDPAWAPTES